LRDDNHPPGQCRRKLRCGALNKVHGFICRQPHHLWIHVDGAEPW
jgi:hypothetical protein